MKDIYRTEPIVNRKKTKIERDTSRVICRAYIPGDISRISKIIQRVLNLSDESTEYMLNNIRENFYGRHKNIEQQLLKNFNYVSEFIPPNASISNIKKMLIGAYFTMEYSVESAALFNPSIVKHPNQSNLKKGELRFIMSLRATGEGHISSIVFRSGIIQNNGNIVFDKISDFIETPTVTQKTHYDSHIFRLQLESMNSWNKTSKRIFERLPKSFTYHELHVSMNVLNQSSFKCNTQTITNINWLANSNYSIKFDDSSKVSERVIFPVSENESNGIEDARFVQFYEDNGESTYYATYTAYNGVCILPLLLETKDFVHFNIITLNGKAVQDKGMALFPRKINGQYVMLSRLDGENNYIMFSDNLHFWNETKMLQEPKMPWEFVQIGNCGSPLETSEGWLVLTHGVGPMRQYSIGAILLDLNDPSKIKARLEKPLIVPNKKEREGYVPNVVYSCGSIIHNGELIIPYAMSDISSGIANLKVKDLIDYMTPTQ